MAVTKPKGMVSWAFYDWANQAFFTIIQTFVFATYFNNAIAPDEVTGTRQWTWMISSVGLVLAFSAPVLGAIADQAGRRKPWIGFFTVMSVVATGLLWFAGPGIDSTVFALSVAFFATLGAELALIFYSAMLPDLVSGERMGRWSGWGWGLGYVGGLLGLMAALFVFVQPEGAFFGLDPDNAEHVRATFILAAVWYGVFSLPLFFKTPDTPSLKKTIPEAVSKGFSQLKTSLKNVQQFKNIIRFLVARLFYNDGVITIFVVGGIYAAGTFNMDEQQILMFGIGLNITAGIGAFGFAWMDDKSGSRFTILFSLVGLMIPIIAILIVDSAFWFIVWGLILGIFVGPIQAASRTFMARLSPPDLTNQMFGLYTLSGKVTSFIGPFLVGLITTVTGSQRIGVSAILFLLIIGFLLMLAVEEKNVSEEAKLA